MDMSPSGWPVGFVGFNEEFVHLLDGKRRITLPATWRGVLGEKGAVFVLPDFHEPCLRLYPEWEWARRMRVLQDRPMSDRKARDFARELGRQSQRVEWDSQGRIRVRDELLDFAGLVDQVRLVGSADTMELWAPSAPGGQGGINQARLQGAVADIPF